MSNGSTNAEKAKWEALRTTPRGRGLVLARVVNPGRVSYPRLPSAKRAKQRAELHAAYLLGLEKNRELGVDPVYRGVCDRDSPHHKQWLKRSKAWDIAHQPKPEVLDA